MSNRSFAFHSTKRKKAAHPEARLQKVIVQHLLMSGVLFFSVPNEAKRSPMMAAHLKAMGMLPGCADLCIIVKGRAHFMEVKSPDGVQSASQRNFHSACVIEGVPYALVNNIGDALKVLGMWGVIRPAKVAA